MGKGFMVNGIIDWIEEKLKEEDNRKKISKFLIYMAAGIITGTFIFKLLGGFV